MLPNIYLSLLAQSMSRLQPVAHHHRRAGCGGHGHGRHQAVGYLRKQDAEKEARQILEKAEIQAAARHKEAEVEAKELALREKSRIEDQLNDARQKTFERERHLDKQQDLLEAAPTSFKSRRRWSRTTSASWPRRSKTPTAARRNSTTCSTSSGRRCTNSAA